jgi:site-specific DNA-methyltransferase (adenine-specific)
MSEFLNKIICGDCIEVLSKVDGPFADLIFADPPFNIGYKYDKYQDKVKSKKYIAWTKDWMSVCKKVLKPHGSFYIAIGDEYAANVKIIADELGLFMRNWIIWHYTFGQQTKDKFARAHTHIFYLVNDERHFTFNDHAVRVPSDRQLIYNDRRANPIGKMPNDVWQEFSRVCRLAPGPVPGASPAHRWQG